MSPYITFILSIISILLITTFTINLAKKITDEKAMVKSVLEIELGLEEKVDQDSNKKNRNETVMVLGRRKYQERKDKELSNLNIQLDGLEERLRAADSQVQVGRE